jgi:hypothetical protein
MVPPERSTLSQPHGHHSYHILMLVDPTPFNLPTSSILLHTELAVGSNHNSAILEPSRAASLYLAAKVFEAINVVHIKF